MPMSAAARPSTTRPAHWLRSAWRDLLACGALYQIANFPVGRLRIPAHDVNGIGGGVDVIEGAVERVEAPAAAGDGDRRPRCSHVLLESAGDPSQNRVTGTPDAQSGHAPAG